LSFFQTRTLLVLSLAAALVAKGRLRPAGTLKEHVRIPFPERIPMDRVAVFALFLFLTQTVEGTALYFSVGTLAFVVLAAVAFNAAGGLTRASGAYIFFYAMLDFIIGVSYKALLGEPGESNLQDPRTTIFVYVVGLVGMFAAVLISRRLSRRSGLLEDILRQDRMYRSTIGCLVFAFGGPVLIGMLGSAAARLQSAFTQLNELSPLGIILGTMYEVRRSGGTRSINLPVIAAIAYTFFIYGILGFSKQGLLIPLYCWGVAICASRYRLSMVQVFSCLLWIVFVFELLVPYSQYGRRFIHDGVTFQGRLEVAETLLAKPLQVRKDYLEEQRDAPPPFHYFNTAQGFWDRLTFLGPDDALVNVTDRGRVFGYLPITASFVNAVPHIFLPNKPVYNFGNMFAHEIGGLPDSDFSTGISFGPAAELYHLGRWPALLVVGPLVWTLMFTVLDTLCGNLRKTPWGLLLITILSHSAPEQGIDGAIYVMTFGAEIVTFCALFSTYVAPAVSTVVLGQSRPPAIPLERRPVALRPIQHQEIAS
jgi:hypothetical protein